MEAIKLLFEAYAWLVGGVIAVLAFLIICFFAWCWEFASFWWADTQYAEYVCLSHGIGNRCG